MAPLFMSGCRPLPTQDGFLEQAAPDATVSSASLRAMVVEYLPNYAHEIESTADRILNESDDPLIRKNALVWKINAISSGFSAASRPDALAAYLDLWVLTRQMNNMFSNAGEYGHFGAWQSQAVFTCQNLDQRLLQINEKIGLELVDGPSFVARTAESYPLQDLYFQRAPIVTQNIEKLEEPKREMMQVLTSMQDDMKDLKRLSGLYAEFLPKQARWQAELMALSAHETPAVESSLASLDVATQAFTAMADTAQKLQSTVDQEVQLLPQIIDDQRQLTLEQLENMRTRSVADLQRERAVVLEELRDEREMVSEWLEQLSDQSMSEADQIVQRGVEQSANRAESILDRVIVSVSLLLAALIATILLFGIAWRWGRSIPRSEKQATTDELGPDSSRENTSRQTIEIVSESLGDDWPRRAA